MKTEEQIVWIVIHGVAWQGCDISSIWDSEDKAQSALQARIRAEGRYEITPSGIYARDIGHGDREYLDVIPRGVCTDLEGFLANFARLQKPCGDGAR